MVCTDKVTDISSIRIRGVHRELLPYNDRTMYVRMDRNEDPVGWDDQHFRKVVSSLSQYDISAYSDGENLRRGLARWQKCPIENVFLTYGADCGIRFLFEAYLNFDDKLLTLNPGWRMYDVYAALNKAKIDFINYDDNFEFDGDQVIEKVASGEYKMFIMANPNQPTGTKVSLDYIEKVCEVGKKTNTVIVIDEAYYLFHVDTAADLIEKFDNLIVVRSFSKAFGLAGLRLGYLLANQQRIEEVRSLDFVTEGNSVSLKFAEYALENIDWILSRVELFNKGRDFIIDRLNECERIFAFPSYGNFVLFKCDDQSRNFVEELKTRSYLIKGPMKIAGHSSLYRISIGPLELMEKFWNDTQDIFKD